MKICENCGREYGNDNPFCPFCDERYGVVFVVDDVISADGLPPYKEEFPVIGETGVEFEDFASNRDKIYKRNIRLAARENFLPKMEVRTAYKPVVPLAEIGRGGAISPYKPPNPIVEKFKNVHKKIKTISIKFNKTVFGILSVAAVFLAVLGISWFETTDTYAAYEQAKRDKESEKSFAIQQAEHIKAIMRNYDRCIYGKNNAVMYLDYSFSNYYDFAYTNETDKDISPADFGELFSGAEGMEDFESIEITYLYNNDWIQTEIHDGIFDFENDDKKEHLIKSGKAVTGYLVEKENTENTVYVPEEITVTSESGLELKLTNCREEIADKIYKYDFEFKNTSDKDMLYFWNEFIDAEYSDKFYKMVVSYPNGGVASIFWNDSPHNGYFYAFTYSGTDEHGKTTYTPPYLYSGNTVSGYVLLDFSDD